MAARMEVIPKTEYSLDGRASSTQVIVLRERIPMVDVVSAVLELRFHGHSGFTNTANAKVKVYPQSESREDLGTFFVGATSLVDVPATGIVQGTVAPALFTGTLGTPIPSMVRVVLEFAQGTTATGAQKLTISADLVGRPA